MTISQLAARWGVNRKTVLRWIRPFEAELVPHGKLFTPQQVEIILSHLE